MSSWGDSWGASWLTAWDGEASVPEEGYISRLQAEIVNRVRASLATRATATIATAKLNNAAEQFDNVGDATISVERMI